jgi:lysozyme
MKTGAEGIALIQRFENCELEAYPDPKTGGVPWTIGWGHTAGVMPGDRCTQEQADEWLGEDLQEVEDLVARHVEAGLTQEQHDAMVSIIYNVGRGSASRDGIIRLKSGRPSTLLRKLNEGDIAGAADEFSKWVSPGSNVERGLKRRRVAERALFLGDDWRRELAHYITSGG